MLGSMALNIGFTSAGFILLFALGMIVTWPSVPWVTLTLGGVAFCAIFPVVFYPFSKTLWARIDLLLHGSSRSPSLGRRVIVARDVTAVALSPGGASRMIIVPAGTELALARERREDVPRVTCTPVDPTALGMGPGEYLVLKASDLAA